MWTRRFRQMDIHAPRRDVQPVLLCALMPAPQAGSTRLCVDHDPQRGRRHVWKTPAVAPEDPAACVAGAYAGRAPSRELPVPPPADAEGCVLQLYDYLWSGGGAQGVRLPHTVVYKYRQPAYWFFTAQDGHLRRKHRAHVTNAHIYAEFTRGAAAADAPVALYVYSCTRDDGAGDLPPGADAPVESVMEHLTADGLHHFLFNREKRHDGLLQRFVPPKEGVNHMVRVTWTPQLVLAEP